MNLKIYIAENKKAVMLNIEKNLGKFSNGEPVNILYIEIKPNNKKMVPATYLILGLAFSQLLILSATNKDASR